MHLTKTALSLLLVSLSCSNTLQSTVAFSSRSFLLYKTLRSYKAISLRSPKTASTQLRVATTEPISVANMNRGIGGRLEDAFAASKERGEAAFITFVTAGYPRAEGETEPEE
jgi:hypothetical protein